MAVIATQEATLEDLAQRVRGMALNLVDHISLVTGTAQTDKDQPPRPAHMNKLVKLRETLMETERQLHLVNDLLVKEVMQKLFTMPPTPSR